MRRLVRTATRLALAFLIADFLTAQDSSEVTLSNPTGPYSVGRSSFYWTDESRRDVIAPDIDQPRELAAFVFYPAAPGSTGAFGEYFPGLAGHVDDPRTSALERQYGPVWDLLVTGRIVGGTLDTPPIAPEGDLPGAGSWPILIFSPGAAAPALGYTIQLKEIASHGYVVVALDHAFDSSLMVAPDGRLIPFTSRPGSADETGSDRWTADTGFAIDRIEELARDPESPFVGRIDLERIGVFGHSAGGAVATRMCQADARVKACFNQDGRLFGAPPDIPAVNPDASIMAPFGMIYVDEPGFTDIELAEFGVTREEYDEMREVMLDLLRKFIDRNQTTSTLLSIRLPDFIHGSFMDMNSIGQDASSVFRSNLSLGTELTIAFFDAMLKDDRTSWAALLERPPRGVSVFRR